MGKRRIVFWLTLLFTSSLLPAQAVSFPENAAVSFNEAPYLISLWNVDEDTYERTNKFCSGVLIDNRTFLTAAHCLEVEDKAFVVVANQSSNRERGEVLSVYDYKIHPRYSTSNGLNDIAVGILNFPSRYNSPLWVNTKRNSSFSKSMNKIIGWGLDQNEIDTGYPMSARVDDFTKSGRKFFKNFNASTQIAAGKYNKVEKVYSGACFGDSGGPLVAINSGKVSVIGITNYISSKGCDVEVPTVFARIKYYIPFIQSTKDSLLAKFNSQETNLPNLDALSLFPTTDKVLPGKGNAESYWTAADLQKGGGVSEEADVETVMFQSFKAENENFYDYSINTYLSYPIEPCVEKQKGEWLIQVALDSRQRVDFAFEIKSGTGCYVRDTIVYDADTILKTPPAQGICNDVGVKPWNASDDSAASTKIDAFSFFFFKPCIGTSNKVWIRINHSVNGSGDIEPGYDMWAGPFSTQIPGETSTSTVSTMSSFTATLDKAFYRIGDVAYLTITGKDSTGALLGSGVSLGTSSSDVNIEFGPHVFRVNPKASDLSSNGQWRYEVIISSVEGRFSGKVQLGNLPVVTVPYGVIK
jgi:elastase-1